MIATYDQVTKNFNTWEARCRGGNCCGHSAPIDPEILVKLQEIRDIVKAPINLTCGFRCIIHNRSLRTTAGRRASKDTSQHCKGLAVDFWIPDGINHDVIFEYAKELFNGTGLYKNFIHVDLRTGRKATWLGSY